MPKTRVITSSPTSRWIMVVAATHATDQPTPVATRAMTTGSGVEPSPTAATATANPTTDASSGAAIRSRPTSDVATTEPSRAPTPVTAAR